MKLSECYYLGYVCRVNDSKNQCVLKLDVDEPSDYKKLESVLIQMREADDQPVPFFISGVVSLNKNELTVQLAPGHYLPDINVLKGTSAFLPLSKLKSKGKDHYYFHEIIGFTVIDDQKGEIGVIKDVYDLPVHPVLAIDQQGKEILIPIHEGTFKEVDKKGSVFKISAPEGLIDLYLG